MDVFHRQTVELAIIKVFGISLTRQIAEVMNIEVQHGSLWEFVKTHATESMSVQKTHC